MFLEELGERDQRGAPLLILSDNLLDLWKQASVQLVEGVPFPAPVRRPRRDAIECGGTWRPGVDAGRGVGLGAHRKRIRWFAGREIARDMDRHGFGM